MTPEKIQKAAEIFGVHPSILMSPMPMDEDDMEAMMMLAQLVKEGTSKHLESIRDLIKVAYDKR